MGEIGLPADKMGKPVPCLSSSRVTDFICFTFFLRRAFSGKTHPQCKNEKVISRRGVDNVLFLSGIQGFSQLLPSTYPTTNTVLGTEAA